MHQIRNVALLLIVVAAGAVALTFGQASADDRHGRTACADGAGRGNDKRLDAVALTAEQRLICFSEKAPERAADIGPVTGLAGDTALVGIDMRPSNGLLYGVGNAGGLYTIDPATAEATKMAMLTVSLSGTSFGVDVNPAADALRIISNTGQNLRFSFATGVTFTDTPLAYPPNAAMGITGAAYTNNDTDPTTATTLFDLDSMLDQVAIQSPANSGQLVATGKLGVDAGADSGFDIYSRTRAGAMVENRALAAVSVGGEYRLYGIDLLTGRATDRGAFTEANDVIGLAILLKQ